VIPPVMISYVFYGIYVNLTVGCDLTGRTQFYAWTTGVAAAFNIAANFLLIPHLGMMGSAWATLAAYVLQAVLLYILTRRIYPVRYRWGRITLAFGVALAVYATAEVIDKYAGGVFGPSAEVLIEGGLLAVWGLFLLASRIVQPIRTAGDRSRNDGSSM
ncbi:MAG: polysaccharide biosynthesis C-terminal domain-containing protein, partial [Candidatus Glassbacteria bacterium]